MEKETVKTHAERVEENWQKHRKALALLEEKTMKLADFEKEFSTICKDVSKSSCAHETAYDLELTIRISGDDFRFVTTSEKANEKTANS